MELPFEQGRIMTLPDHQPFIFSSAECLWNSKIAKFNFIILFLKLGITEIVIPQLKEIFPSEQC